MKEYEDVLYYELPPFYANRIILPMYTIIDKIVTAAPGLALEPAFEKHHNLMKESMKAADPEMPFIMDYYDCFVLCRMMDLFKVYYFRAMMPDFIGRDDLTEEEKTKLVTCDLLMKYIDEIGEGFIVIFPLLKVLFYQEELRITKEKDEAKTLGLDKTTMAIQFSLSDILWSSYIKGLFACFNYFIMLGKSDFSVRVRAAPFCCVSEVREVQEIFDNALAATTLDEDYTTSFSLRDVVVLLMMNNIMQKAYFSDGGDEIHDFYNKVMKDSPGDNSVNMRDSMLMHAKALQEIVCDLAENTEGFEEAMKPILEFEV